VVLERTFSEQLLPSDGVVLNLASGPRSGPPLLLLHGLARRWQDFVPLLPALMVRWQVLGLDFRGHGATVRTPGRYRVVDYVRDAVNVVQSHQVEPVVVIGHSLGALVAGAVAAEIPEMVRAIVLEDPPSTGFFARLRETMYYALFSGMHPLAGTGRPVRELARALGELCVPAADGRGTIRLADVRDAASLRNSARCLQDVDPEVYEPILEMRWLEGYSAAETWHGVRCPALLLRGEEALGGMLPSSDADQIAGWLADCTRVDLPGVGHLIHGTAVETTVRLVTAFLESL
jgi:pimeloyl-ACP methyl ester carboxylesterase